MRSSRAAPDLGTASLTAGWAAPPSLLRGRPLLLLPTCAPAAPKADLPLQVPLLSFASAACMLLSSLLPHEQFLTLAEAADDAIDAAGPVPAG